MVGGVIVKKGDKKPADIGDCQGEPKYCHRDIDFCKV